MVGGGGEGGMMEGHDTVELELGNLESDVDVNFEESDIDQTIDLPTSPRGLASLHAHAGAAVSPSYHSSSLDSAEDLSLDRGRRGGTVGAPQPIALPVSTSAALASARKQTEKERKKEMKKSSKNSTNQAENTGGGLLGRQSTSPISPASPRRGVQEGSHFELGLSDNEEDDFNQE